MTSDQYIHQLFGMTGRTAVVTGSSSGLGAEMTNAIAPGYHYTEMTEEALNDPELSERLKRSYP